MSGAPSSDRDRPPPLLIPPRLLPPHYFLSALASMVILHLVWPLARWGGSAWRVGEVILVLGGLSIVLTGAQTFRRRGTAIKPFERSSALVTDGVFRYSRNPMYLGMVLMLIGVGLLLGSLTPFLVVPVFIWWISQRFIRREEEMLTEQFGAAYLDYRSRVRRWL